MMVFINNHPLLYNRYVSLHYYDIVNNYPPKSHHNKWLTAKIVKAWLKPILIKVSIQIKVLYNKLDMLVHKFGYIISNVIGCYLILLKPGRVNFSESGIACYNNS
jgi:hypothetical protein